jgi:hypothetical protein
MCVGLSCAPLIIPRPSPHTPHSTQTFVGRTEGHIVPAAFLPTGPGPEVPVFGWDPIFKPLEFEGTYAQMPKEVRTILLLYYCCVACSACFQLILQSIFRFALLCCALICSSLSLSVGEEQDLPPLQSIRSAGGIFRRKSAVMDWVTVVSFFYYKGSGRNLELLQ